jgi:hypothetical protein
MDGMSARGVLHGMKQSGFGASKEGDHEGRPYAMSIP